MHVWYLQKIFDDAKNNAPKKYKLKAPFNQWLIVSVKIACFPEVVII